MWRQSDVCIQRLEITAPYDNGKNHGKIFEIHHQWHMYACAPRCFYRCEYLHPHAHTHTYINSRACIRARIRARTHTCTLEHAKIEIDSTTKGGRTVGREGAQRRHA